MKILLFYACEFIYLQEISFISTHANLFIFKRILLFQRMRIYLFTREFFYFNACDFIYFQKNSLVSTHENLFILKRILSFLHMRIYLYSSEFFERLVFEQFYAILTKI